MMDVKIDELNWEKVDGLMPAIVQSSETGQVLMLGYMNRAALEKTLSESKVTFWSRTRETLWTKGETSGNFLLLKDIKTDCDQDTLLVTAEPHGPTCHTGTVTCFVEEETYTGLNFLASLESLIEARKQLKPKDSYTTELFEKGINQICKKVGEEAVEVIVSTREDSQRTVEESADLLYHLLVLLSSRGLRLSQVMEELERRHSA